MTTFEVWSPDAEAVAVDLGHRREALSPDPIRPGWWSVELDVAAHGTDYAFVVDGSDPLPDPRSRWQPNGVHAPSRTYDHDRFEWHDHDWRGPSGPTVIYELHVGTFTPDGTFAAAIDELDHLVTLGITHVELLPLASFDGPHGWGYDGVALFAVHEPYGGPDGCKAFVDACHQRGIGVIFDVVYNHLGPSGNHLGRYGPYFTDRHLTPWGEAVNLDGAGSDEVRAFILDNARSWIEDLHGDGLRLDATHELHDGRARTLLEEIGELGDQLADELGRPVVMIAESDRNDPRVVTERQAGGIGLHGQWNDDVHHAMHALLSGERQGYYVDFGELATLAKAWTDVFVHDGAMSTFRGRHHGRPVPPDLPADRFVTCLQNHDQVGNRAVGDRLGATVDVRVLEIGAALLLTGPFTPLLFMGEEWGASTPWPFFTSFPDPDLAEAVRTGRRAEFGAHGWAAEEVPDPQDPATFRSAKLDWSEVGRGEHRRLLDWYRSLIALRRAHPGLVGRRPSAEDLVVDEDAATLVADLGEVQLLVNLGSDERRLPLRRRADDLRVLLTNDAAVDLVRGAVALPGRSVAVIGPG